MKNSKNSNPLVTYQKPKNIRYVDMCIYIDKNMRALAEKDKYPEIESTIFEYLYHIFYALSYKAGYFYNMGDYEQFAIFGATDVFLSMRRKFQHEGEIYRGKVVKPIKSCLNYIKATLYPLKVDYQRLYFNDVTDEADIEQTSAYSMKLKETVAQQTSQTGLGDSFAAAVDIIEVLIDNILNETPFKKDSLMYFKLKISILLSLLEEMTLPCKVEYQLTQENVHNKDDVILPKTILAYDKERGNTITWHLPDSYESYIQLLVIKTKKALSAELNYYVHADDLSEELIDGMLRGVYERRNGEED